MTGADEAGGGAVLPLGSTKSARRVLVIEDEESICAYLAMVLELSGYEVVCRESALGMATLLRRWRPDVILLDLRLPHRSGAEVLADCKADPATATIPIVIISGAPNLLAPVQASMTAAVLTKPVRMQTLLDTVDTAVAGSR